MGNLFNKVPQPVINNPHAEYIFTITYCGV
jgi:hypothetical protein